MFGNVFRKYPYQDFNEYNLDWLLNRMKQLNDDFNSFTISNKLKYADPINWSITKNYDPNTMVVNGNTAYISLKPVPAGVSINDTEYWLEAFTASAYSDLYTADLNLQNDINGNLLRIQLLEAGTTLPDFVKYPAKQFNDSYAVCFGDSNTLANPPSGYGNIFNRICNYLNPKDKKSYGENSAAFQNGISGCPVIADQVANANDFPENEVGFVFLMGGINDYHYGATDATAFGAAVGNTINTIHTKFPKAIIVAAMDSGSRLPNGMMLLYQASFSRGATNNTSGVPVLVVSLADIPLSENLFVNTNHYNDTGATVIATRVINKLFGGGTGYQIRPRRFVKHYTSDEPGPNGAYNFYVASITMINPEKLERVDWHRIYTATDFNPGNSSSAAEFCELPGTYQPAYYFGQDGGYMPFSLLYSTSSSIEAVKLENVDREVLTREPKIIVKNIYDKTFTGKRGYLEFESRITMWDTGN